jgi:hypothetical protein
VAVPLILAACSSHDSNDGTQKTSITDAKFVARDSTRVLGPGDVQIASTDSAVELGIFGDTMVAGLGRKVLDKVRNETDTAAVQGSGLGANLEKFVKQNVANALNHQMLFPVAEISDVQYSDGSLQFYGSGGAKMHVFENKSDDKGNHSTFSEPDAQRFIAAFKARKNHGV